jgi:hypothetical protein
MPVTVFSPTVLGSSTGSTADAAVAIAEATLTDLCEIWRRNPDATNDEGGPTDTWPDAWALVAADVPCRLLKQTKVSETVSAGDVASFSSWTLEVAIGRDLQPGDRVVKNAMLWDIVDTNLGESSPLLLTAIVTRRGR